jgi:hypothetical protein
MARNDTQFYPTRSRARQLTNDKRLGDIHEMFPLMKGLASAAKAKASFLPLEHQGGG